MKFKHGTRRRAAEYEKDWVQRWKDDDTLTSRSRSVLLIILGFFMTVLRF